MRDGWILDRLLRAGGIDVLWPEVMGTLIEMGFKYADVDRAMSRVGSLAAMPKQWLRLADHHFIQASQAEIAGHQVTASETYYRAAGCYARARWGSLDPEQLSHVYGRLIESYERGIRAGAWPVERVEITVGDSLIPALLHLPKSGSERHPVVLVYPGMDMTKEYFPVPFNNLFERRGLATLVLDPPGQGESQFRGALLDASNSDRAGRAAIDYLASRGDIDANRIAVVGIGTSSYSVLSLAASDHRLAAVVGFEGTDFYDRVRFINEVQPAFEARMKRMTGLDGKEFLEFAATMTLWGREADIAAPLMLVLGEWDEHVPLAEARRFFDRVQSPRRLVVYEGENHVLGRVSAEALQMSADWIVDRLAGVPLDPRAEEVLVSEY